MTQTIEEAARDYAANANVTSENFCPEDITDAFENGAWYVKDLPLRDRLTEAEREAVRRIGYKLGMRGPAEALSCLVSLFGEELVYGPGMFGRE